MSSRLRLLPRLSVILLVLFFGVALHAQTCTPPTIVQYSINPGQVCPGSSVQLDAGDGWMTYLWSNGQTGRYLYLNPTVTATYSVTVQDANACTATASHQVVVQGPDGPVINAPSTTCPLVNETASVQPPPGGGTWNQVAWTITGGHFDDPVTHTNPTTASGTTVTFVADGSGPVTLSASAMDSNWCWSFASTVQIAVASLSATINAPLEVCPMGSGVASVAPPSGGGNWSYVSWQIANGQFNGPSGPTNTASGASVYFYADNSGQPVQLIATVSDASFCQGQATKTVGVRTIAPPVISAPLEICPMGSGTASVAPPAEGSSWGYVSWDIAHGQFSGPYGPVQTASGTSVSFYGDNSGQPVVLHVTATDGQFCGAEATKTVGMRTIAAPVISAPLEICPMGSGTASVAPPAEGSSWGYVSWTISNGQFSGPYGPVPNASGTSVSFYGDNSGLPIVLHVTATDGQFCGSEATKTVGMRTIAAPVITAPLEVCPMGSGTASVAPPAEGSSWGYISWQITNGQFAGAYGPASSASGQSVSFYPDNSGQPVVLHVIATDGQFCSSEATKTVGMRTIAAPVISAPLQVCAMGSGTASVAPPAEGSWGYVSWTITNGQFSGPNGPANAASGESVTFYPDGSGLPISLTALATDGAFCSASATRSVAVAAVNATITPEGSTTLCESGSVKLSAPAGAAAYLWSTGATTREIWASAAGSYTVTVTTAAGCSATSAPVQVTILTVVRPSIVAPAAYCAGSGTATASTSGGSPVTYDWEILFGGTLIGPTHGPTVQFSSTQTYGSILLSVWTTDAQGCTVRDTHEVPIEYPLAPALSGTGSMCTTSIGTVQVDNPRAGSTYRWAITAGGIIDTVINSQTGQADPYGDRLTWHATGSYTNATITATEVSAAGCSKSATYSVPLQFPPAVDFNVNPNCPNGPGLATATTAPGFGTTYVWQVTNANITSGQGTQTVHYTATGSNPVSVTLTANSSSCATSVTKVGTILSIAQPTINIPVMACPGGAHAASVTGGPYDQITWTAQNATITSQNGSNVYYTAGQSGEIVLTAVVSQGTCTNSNTRTVPIATPQVTAPASVCPTGTFNVTYPAGYANYTVNYYHAFEVSSGTSGSEYYRTFRPDGSGIPIQITIDFQPQVTGCTVTVTKIVAVEAAAPPVIAFDAPAGFCAGMTATATVSNTDYATYAWTVTGGTIVGSPSGRTIQFTWSDATKNLAVNVNVVDARGCAATAGAVPPMANVVPTISSSGINKICPGQTRTLTASSTNADSYLWSNGGTTRAIVVSTGGDYTVTTTKNGCSLTSQPYQLTAINPVVTLSAASTSYCAGSSGTLTATYSGGSGNTPLFRLYWSDGTFLGSSSTGVFTASANFTADYYVIVTENSNTTCATQSNTLRMTVLPQPAGMSSNGPLTFCEGGSVTLSGAAGMTSYAWSTGATTPSITVSQSGTYSLTVTNANGCTRNSSMTVNVNPLPVATITAGGPLRFCEGGSVTLTASAGLGWLWSNGATTQSINVTQSGSYTVRVASSSCTKISDPVSVIVDPRPSTVITADGPTTFCEGGSVALTAPDSASYLWSTGATTRSIAADATGAYSVTVTNAAGCSATSTPLQVTEAAPPSAPVITAGGPTTFCEGGSVTLSAPAGASYLWSNGATTQSIDVTAAGSYSVTVTNASGCSTTSAATAVTVNPLPGAVISASGPTTFCTGGSVTLSAPAGASYLWSTGATTPSIVASTAGAYSVTVTSAAGCSRASAPVTVTVNPLPTSGIHETQIYDDTGSGTISRTGDTIEACGNPTVRLIPNALNASYTYLWSTGATTAILNVQTSGTYSVTVTTPSGCAVTSTVTVHYGAIPAKPVIAATGTELCPAGGSITLTAPAAEAWEWSNGATTQSILVSQPGSYTVRVRNGACQSVSSDPKVITTGNSTISTTDSLALCGNASATLTANAGTSWLWSNGATTQSIVVTAPGTFSVTTTNNGCTMPASSPVTVTQRAVTISAGGPTTFCAGNSVTLTANGGTSWLWSSGATTQSIVVSQSGSYSVTASFADGCSLTATPVVVEARQLTASIAADRTTVCAGSSIALQSTAGGSAGYTYQWYDNTYAAIAGATSPTLSLTPSASGFVYLKVTDELGCQVTSNSILYTVVPPANSTITAAAAICEGQSGSASVPNAGAGTTYAWTITGGTLNVVNAPSVTFTPSGLGSVTLTVTVTNAGCSSTSSKTVTVNPLPGSTISASGPTTFCTGGSVTLTAAAGSSWIWTNGATTRAITVAASGSYGVTVTGTGGCSTTAAPVAVTVNPVPTATITAGGATTFCEGGSVTLTTSAGSSWLWSNGATTQAINLTQSGSYSVSVTNASGCTATSAPKVVTVNPLPTPTITASGPTTFCAGGSVTLTGNGGSGLWYRNGSFTTAAQPLVLSGAGIGGDYVYRITTAAGCTADSAPVTVTVVNSYTTTTGSSQICWSQQGSQKLNGTQPGTAFAWTATGGTIVSGQGTEQVFYTADAGSTNVRLDVAITQPSGCVTNSTFNIPVEGTMKPAVTAQGPTTFCPGGSVTLVGGTAPAGYTYSWSTGATTPSITASVSGSYTLNYRRTVTGCQSIPSDPIVVTVDSVTPTISAGGPTTFCTGGSVTLTASAGSSYLWSTGATTQAIAVSTAGNYTVTVTNANGCSGTSAARTVTVTPLPTATITPSGPTTFCAGGIVTLSASAGSSYLWSNGATSSFITVSTSGSYSVTITNANGCSATSAPTTVTVNPLPPATITAGGPTTFCAGGSVTLTASAGASYLWSNGATTQSIAASSSGNYSVTVTNANGCSATSAPTSVTVNPLPTATITAGGPTTFCAGGSVTLTASAGSSYLWSTGATTQSIVANATGNYTVTVTNPNGCSATSSPKPVTVNALPSATITAGGPTTFCAGGSVTLTASAGSSYLWSNGATTSSIAVAATGNYSVTVTNASGCSATSSPTSVTVNPLPAASITAGGPTTFCTGGSVTLTASAGSSYLWSTGATTQSIVANSTGSYSATVTNASGCSATSSATAVTVNPLPTATITAAGPTTFCTGGSVTLTASAGSSYLWSTGATTSSIAVSSTGNYSVTVTNASGCSATSSPTSVTVNAAPTTTITAGGPTTFCAGGSVTLTASAGSSYLWSTGATTQSIAANATGNYTVTVTNASGCSTTSSPTAVTVNAAPTATITAGGPTTFCAGGSVTLTASAGASYLWSTGATTQSIAANATGNYSVTVTNASGCSATSAPTSVTVNAPPAATITAGGPTTFCTGGSVTLTASAGASYLWSTGATTSSIAVSTAGNYTVTVTNAGGCSATSSPTSVTVNAKPGSTIGASGPTTFCTGGSVTLTAPAGSTYAWSTGATSPSIVVSTSGSYGVTVTNAAGCSTAATPVTVTVNAQPATPTITPSGPTTFCPGGSVTLTAPAGFTYLWSTGATTQSIAASTAGNYTVTVTNASGCSTTSAATTVTLNAATAITAQQANKTIARNTSTTLSVTATGTNLTYQLYRGNVGVTTTPVGSQTSNPSLSTGVLSKGTYTFWIKVFGTCGNVNGNAITVVAN
jgi:hypothetical protein